MVKEKYAFLFPGQGAQAPGMMKDICETSAAARRCVENASAVLGEDIGALLWDSVPETLMRSDRSQVAIAAASAAVVAALEEKGITPSAAAGFSLGEWPALYAAGVLSFEDMLKTVKARGEIMQRVCDEIAAGNAGRAPGMAAVIGLPPGKITELLAPFSGGTGDLFPVNFNSPRQTVVAGTAEGLERGERLCREAGARRYVRLSVAGPFHSPLMRKAADEFAAELETVAFADPRIALFSNVTGARVSSGTQAKELAARHIVSPVLWTDEEAALADMFAAGDGQWIVLETGPGKTLSGLWKDAAADNVCVPVNSAEAVAGL